MSAAQPPVDRSRVALDQVTPARTADTTAWSGPATPRRRTVHHTRTAALLVAGAVSANVAFTGLGSVFDYPAILKKPATDVLVAFRDHQAAVSLWFLLLAVSSALLAPIAVAVGRLSTHRAMRLAVPIGIAAATVQVVGLLRWPLLVPSFAADAASSDPSVVASATDAFATANRILGTTIGETLGYALTAGWTSLVILALGVRFAGRWFTALGATSAFLVLTGVLSPLGLTVVDQANFIGYVLWSLWLISFAVVLLVQGRREAAARTTSSSATAS